MLEVVGMNEIDSAPALEFRGLVAQDAGATGADSNEGALSISNEDQV
jgi:hypothetical protein